MSRRRFPSLSQLLGLGRDEAPRHARREPTPEWVHPYPEPEPEPEQQDARLAGEEYRARYLNYTLDEAGHARAAGIGGAR